MTEYEYYDYLWDQKEEKGIFEFNQKRDWLHKHIIDRVFNPFANNRTQMAAKHLNGGKRILDLGIWGGGFLSSQEMQSKYLEFYGLDLPLPSVKMAKSKGIDAQVWNLNSTPYPFAENSFDAITALAVIEHVFDPIAVIREINRLLIFGGQIIVALPNIVSFSNRVRSFCGYPPVTSLDPGWDGGHLHNFTIPTTKKLLQQSGFKITGLSATGSGLWLRNAIPTILAGEFVIVGEKEMGIR